MFGLRWFLIDKAVLTIACYLPVSILYNLDVSKLSITADTDLRFAKAFGVSEGFWLGLQVDYDLEKQRSTMGKKLGKINKLSCIYSYNLGLVPQVFSETYILNLNKIF